MSSELIIKVKYRETLRRFSVLYNGDGSLSLDMAGLKAKIFSLFNFASNADLNITYADEDNDMVTLVDDADLRDAVKQGLCPLRITVSLNSDCAGNSDRSGTSTHMPPLHTSIPSSPFPSVANTSSTTGAVPGQDIALSKLVQDLASKVALAAPEQYRDFISKVSNDVVSKASAAVPASLMFELIDALSKLDKSDQQSWVFPTMSELIQTLSKLGISCNDSVSQGQVGTESKKQTNGSDICQDSRISDNLKAATVPVSSNKVLSRTRNDVPTSNSAGLSRSVSTSDARIGATDKVCNDSAQSRLSHAVRLCKEKIAQKKSSGYPNSNRIPCVIPSPTIRPLHGLAVLPDDPQSNRLSWQMGQHAPVYVPSVFSLPRHHGRRYLNYDHMGRVVHLGVECDGCQVHPVTGPRYKSRVKDDYDLCSNCFAELGNATDYTRLDHPICNRYSLKKLHNYQVERQVVPPDGRHQSKLDCKFIEDVTIVDGTVMAPLTPFTKIWRVHNNGALAWPHGTKLVWIGGEQMMTGGQSFEIEVPTGGCLVGMGLNVAIPFIAPQHPGQYVSYWRMASPSGMKFGQCVWVLIQVQVDSKSETRSESLRSLNLNLPPVSADFEDLLDVNVEPGEASYENLHSDMAELLNPVVGGGMTKEMGANNSKLLSEVVESVNPVVERSTNKEMDANNVKLQADIVDSLNTVVDGSRSKEMDANNLKLQADIVDSLNTVVDGSTSKEMDASNSNLDSQLVGLQGSVNEGSSSKEMEPKTGGLINDNSMLTFEWPDAWASFSSDAHVVPTVSSSPVSGVRAGQVDDGKTLEQTLLKELDEMGFKEIDLNRKVLRENEYDLERSLDELCCFADWDPMLEELEAMGFPDAETNRKLLIKNGGSIKRVVMDLIAAEQS